jgi:hypothetical protein
MGNDEVDKDDSDVLHKDRWEKRKIDSVEMLLQASKIQD